MGSQGGRSVRDERSVLEAHIVHLAYNRRNWQRREACILWHGRQAFLSTGGGSATAGIATVWTNLSPIRWTPFPPITHPN